MGTTTKFTGRLQFNKEVSRKHEAEFLRFVEQCSEQKLDHSVWEPTPNNYCQWRLSFDENHSYLGWVGGEKFYDYVEWLEYLIKHFFGPKGYVLNGKLSWKEEGENGDSGVIKVTENMVTNTEDAVLFRGLGEDELREKLLVATTALQEIEDNADNKMGSQRLADLASAALKVIL